MFLSSLIEELCTKEENNKAGCTLTFGGQCRENPYVLLFIDWKKNGCYFFSIMFLNV